MTDVANVKQKEKLGFEVNKWGLNVNLILLILSEIPNLIFGLRVEPWSATRPNISHHADIGQCHMLVNVQLCATANPSWVVVCTGLSNNGLVLAVVASFSNLATK